MSYNYIFVVNHMLYYPFTLTGVILIKSLQTFKRLMYNVVDLVLLSSYMVNLERDKVEDVSSMRSKYGA